MEVIELFLKCDVNICLKLIFPPELGVSVSSNFSEKLYSKYYLKFTHELYKIIGSHFF